MKQFSQQQNGKRLTQDVFEDGSVYSSFMMLRDEDEQTHHDVEESLVSIFGDMTDFVVSGLKMFPLEEGERQSLQSRTLKRKIS